MSTQQVEKKYVIAEFLMDNCAGKSNALYSKKLQAIFGISGEYLREIVNELRNEGFPICSGNVGYWYAQDENDIRETLEHLNGRVYGVTKAINGLESYLRTI